jgi:phytoene dehydrogenase-like protein
VPDHNPLLVDSNEIRDSKVLTTVLGGEVTYADDPATEFYRFGKLNNVYMCGSGTYPCGSVTGTPGYMCSQQVLRLDGNR